MTATLIVRVMLSVIVRVSVFAPVPFLSWCHGDYHGFVRHVWCVHGAWESGTWIESGIDDGGVWKRKQTSAKIYSVAYGFVHNKLK